VGQVWNTGGAILNSSKCPELTVDNSMGAFTRDQTNDNVGLHYWPSTTVD